MTEPSTEELFDRAVALVVGQSCVSPLQARRWIRCHAFETGRNIDEVARDVLALRLEFVDSPPD